MVWDGMVGKSSSHPAWFGAAASTQEYSENTERMNYDLISMVFFDHDLHYSRQAKSS